VVEPSIELVKTVGLDPNVCATSDSLEVPGGSSVTYCYEVTNTGDVALAFHDLVDSELGTLLDDFPYDLLPGESVFITETATILTDTVNTAVWTAFNDDMLMAQATDSATVTTIWPAITLDKTVGTQEGVCAETEAIEVVTGSEVFYCYSVENVGDTTLAVHTLEDSALGVLFSDLELDLLPGESYSYIHEGVVITQSVVNTATWWAYLELGGYYVSAVDQASVAVLTEADLSLVKDGPAMVYVGEDITYELTVANAGPADATGVMLIDTLPEGVTFVSASQGCVEAAGIVTCDIGNLAAGESVQITIVVSAPAEPGLLTNSAEVSGEQPDSLVEDNTAASIRK
jgi:uncharacterized repeat protein (TIGR01451 family)